MVKVLICGGGNGAHVMSAVFSSRPEVQVHVLTVYENEAGVWSDSIKSNDFSVKMNQAKGPPVYVTSKPELITRDPAVAAQGCDVIVLVVPSYAHHVFLRALKPYVKEGTVLIGCPGHAGFEYEVRHILGDIWESINLISVESLPWACRITEYGKSAEVLATKATLIGAIKPASRQGSTSADPVASFQKLLGSAPKLQMTSTFLGLSLKGLNACIHPSIMFGYWKNWDGKPLNQPPLFYNGLDQDTANILSNLSTECVSVAKEVMRQRPDIELAGVEHVFDWFLRTYQHDVTDTSSLFSTIRTNRAYQGLRHPCSTTTEGQFMPDFGHRYLREDIPYGLVVIKGVAQILGLSTPVMDKIISWAQGRLGQEFLVGERLCGEDVPLSRVPQVYNITSLDELLASSL